MSEGMTQEIADQMVERVQEIKAEIAASTDPDRIAALQQERRDIDAEAQRLNAIKQQVVTGRRG